MIKTKKMSKLFSFGEMTTTRFGGCLLIMRETKEKEGERKRRYE